MNQPTPIKRFWRPLARENGSPEQEGQKRRIAFRTNSDTGTGVILRDSCNRGIPVGDIVNALTAGEFRRNCANLRNVEIYFDSGTRCCYLE